MASAGASLTPSPTIATEPNLAAKILNRSHLVFRHGDPRGTRRCRIARRCPWPSTSLSPVSITIGLTPCSLQQLDGVARVGRTRSATATMPTAFHHLPPEPEYARARSFRPSCRCTAAEHSRRSSNSRWFQGAPERRPTRSFGTPARQRGNASGGRDLDAGTERRNADRLRDWVLRPLLDRRGQSDDPWTGCAIQPARHRSPPASRSSVFRSCRRRCTAHGSPARDAIHL